MLVSQVVLVVKNSTANAGDVRDMGSIPGSGRSLEKGMATHSSNLAWEIPGTEEPGIYSPCSHKESDTTEQLRTKQIYYYILNAHIPILITVFLLLT